MLALAAALSALLFRVTGVGLFQTQTMHCPALQSWAVLLLAGLAFGAVALAVAGPAVSALILALFAFRPTVCM